MKKSDGQLSMSIVYFNTSLFVFLKIAPSSLTAFDQVNLKNYFYMLILKWKLLVLQILRSQMIYIQTLMFNGLWFLDTQFRTMVFSVMDFNFLHKSFAQLRQHQENAYCLVSPFCVLYNFSVSPSSTSFHLLCFSIY